MAFGDIGAASDPLIWEAVNAEQPSLVYRGFNICVVTYKGVDGHGWVKTFACSDAGVLGDAFIDSLEFEDTNCEHNTLIQVDGSVFAVVYQGDGNVLTVKTFSVDSEGEISASASDPFTWLDAVGYDPDICHVDGYVYVIAFTNNANDPVLTTIEIDGGGLISHTTTPDYVLGAASGADPAICHIKEFYFAIAANYDEDNHRMITTGIDEYGEFDELWHGACVFDDAGGLQFDVFAHWPAMVAVIYYKDDDATAWIKTMQVGAMGALSGVIDSKQVGDGTIIHPQIIKIFDDIFVFVYQDAGGAGQIKSIEIGGAGEIGENWLDEEEIEASLGGPPSIAHIAGDIYVVVYQKGAFAIKDGYARSIGVETPVVGRTQQLMGLL